MDTLEWGTSESSARVGGWQRQGPRWLGPPLAVGLAGAGAALAVAAEVLPWMGIALTGENTAPPTGLGIDRLNTISVLAYYIGWIGLLGVAGLVLTARPAARRAAAGVALGLGAALIMVLAGIIRWILVGTGLTDAGTLSTDGSARGVSLGPGVFCACAAVLLVIAAVLVGVRRRAPLLASSPVAVAAATRADEPADLTVQPALPADERLFIRPDGARPQHR